MFHDRLFKQLMQSDFPSAIDLFYPKLGAQVDFSGLEWLDKEQFTDLPNGVQRESDLVARAALKKPLQAKKQELRFLFLTEVEAKKGQRVQGLTLPERLFQYYTMLRNRHRLPVFPLVIYIRGEAKGLSRGLYRETLLGAVLVSFRYYTIGLSALDAEKYLAHGSAIAAALASTMNGGQWSRAEHKARCLNAVAKSQSNDAQKGIAINHVETYLKLEGEEAQQFNALLAEEEYMQAQEIHLTWFDEIMLKGEAKGEARGEARGRQEGLINGQRRALALMLARKFGTLSAAVMARLDALTTSEALDALTLQVLTASSLHELGLE